MQDASLFILQLGRNDNRNRAANGFLGAPSEEALSTPVPAHDDSVEILGEDGVFRRSNNSGKLEPGGGCSSMRFTQGDNAGREAQESQHPEKLRPIFEGEEVSRRQEPVPHAECADERGSDRRSQTAIPCREDDRKPSRVVWIRFPEQGYKQISQVKGCKAGKNCFSVAHGTITRHAHDGKFPVSRKGTTLERQSYYSPSLV